MKSDGFPLTQQFAAMMLGATRPTVSLVAATLQKAGLITHTANPALLIRMSMSPTSVG